MNITVQQLVMAYCEDIFDKGVLELILNIVTEINLNLAQLKWK